MKNIDRVKAVPYHPRARVNHIGGSSFPAQGKPMFLSMLVLGLGPHSRQVRRAWTLRDAKLYEINQNTELQFKHLKATLPTTHSIPEPLGIGSSIRRSKIVCTGDFKFDLHQSVSRDLYRMAVGARKALLPPI